MIRFAFYLFRGVPARVAGGLVVVVGILAAWLALQR
jgi:hypothetical protein